MDDGVDGGARASVYGHRRARGALRFPVERPCTEYGSAEASLGGVSLSNVVVHKRGLCMVRSGKAVSLTDVDVEEGGGLDAASPKSRRA